MDFCQVTLRHVMLLALVAGIPCLAGSAQAAPPACACQATPGCNAYGVADMNFAGGAGPGDEAMAFDLGEGAPAQSGTSFAVLDDPGGYIDSAIIGTQFRLRFDAAYNNPMPDRVEFFYGQCGCFGGNAPGPILPETSVDYQEFIPYFEWAYSDRLSFFLETPARLINPEVNPNAGGFSDVNVGVKYALIAHPDEYLTLQLRVYTPTGDVGRGLGTGHTSLEPAVLYFRRLSDRLTLQAELRDWIPISDSVAPNGDNFAGNVLRYGIGLGYDLYCCDDGCTTRRLTPVAELVGWSILDGYGFNGNTPALGAIDQSGVTIVNAKFGVRYTFGQNSVYAGFGTALTSEVWYEDILRLEYRHAF